MLAVDPGTRTFAILLGKGNGALADPIVTPAAVTPTVVRIGQFTSNTDADLDAVFLDPAPATASTRVMVRGAFLFIITGGGAGLAVRNVDGDHRADLLIGNEFGDVLTLLGNGDGKFAFRGDGQ